jgi:hypothetical protein
MGQVCHIAVCELVLQHDSGGGGTGAPAPVAERTVAEILSGVRVAER